MPRFYKRKTEMGLVPHSGMLQAVNSVLEGKKSVRKVAAETGISKTALARYVNKYKADPECRLTPNYTHSQVFTDIQEDSLAEYIETISKMFHGLTPAKVKQLAYEMAVKNKLPMPKRWSENKTAGRDWLTMFLKRHPRLSIRSPEATSLARATAFNKHTVGQFFDLLEALIKRHTIDGTRIYNLDESGFTTVQKVPKVITAKGQKQVGQITSRERGELVTVTAIVSASGTGLPPVFIYPRKNYRDIFLTGAPEASLGLATESGWMNTDLFQKVMEHVITHTHSSKETPIILIMDNHESHIAVPTLEYAKEHGVNIITLPPHTSHKTQPLDRSVFGPMKAYYNAQVNSWMMKNPGKTVTIYQIAELVGAAWMKAATPGNITSGFRISGIWPFQRDVFGDDEFLPASMTDRPEVTDTSGSKEVQSQDQPTENNSKEVQSEEQPAEYNSKEVQTPKQHCSPCTSESLIETNAASTSTPGFITPERLLGYPKADARKQKNTGGRKRGKTMIATSTPELKRMKEESLLRAARKERRESVKKVRKQLIQSKRSGSAKKQESSSSSEDDEEPHLSDTDDDVETPDASDDEGVNQGLEIGTVNFDSLNMDSYVLVEFSQQKRSPVYYIGKIMSEFDSDSDCEIEFLRKSQKVKNKFVKPNIADVASTKKKDIKFILPKPICKGTTARTKDGVVFPIDFGNLDVR